jgi:hypothetical protein
VLVVVAVMSAACATTTITVETPVRADPGTGVAVAFIEEVPLTSSSGYRRDLVSCVMTAIHAQLPGLRSIPGTTLLHALYSTSSEAADALDPLSLMLLQDDPAARQRVSASGIRYVVAVSGGSRMTGASDAIMTPVLIVAGWTRQSEYAAELYDLNSGQVVGRGSATAEAAGGYGLGILPPFVYVLPSLTHSRACERLGTVVVHALGGPRPPTD